MNNKNASGYADEANHVNATCSDPARHTRVTGFRSGELRDDRARDRRTTLPLPQAGRKAARQAPFAFAADRQRLPQERPLGKKAPAPAVNLRVLEELVGDDPLVIADLLQEFRKSAQDSKAALAHGASSAAVDEVANAAHRLKSSARAIGAERLGDACAEIEQAAQAGRLDFASTLITQLDLELNRVLRFLDEY
jgi:HPt (histidine-containing phosphotransfer) domain-containing protein